MGESLTQQRRVRDDGLRGCKPLSAGTKASGLIARQLTVPAEEGPANYVPAAAVIRRDQALVGFTGRKGRVGGAVSHL